MSITEDSSAASLLTSLRMASVLTDEQQSGLNDLAREIEYALKDDLSLMEYQAIIVLLGVRWIGAMIKAAPDRAVDVEGLAESIRESIVRTWSKTAAKRGQ